MADRRRTVRNRSLLAVGVLILVAGILVGTLFLTGGFGGTSSRGTTASPTTSAPTVTSENSSAASTTPTSSSAVESPAALLPQAAEGLLPTILVVSAPGEAGFAVFARNASTAEHLALTGISSAPTAPVLSPDRRTVLWVEGDQVIVVGADGRGRRELFAMPADCTGPARPSWNPEVPTELVLTCAGGQGPRLLVVDLTGQVLRELPTSGLQVIDDIEVSADGTELMFRGTWETGFDPDQLGSLWTVKMDGSAPPVDLITEATDGVWSPDGRIAYRKLTGDGNAVIVVSDRTGENAQQFSPDGATVGAPFFSRDGTQLAWTVVSDEGQILMMAEVADATSGRPVGGTGLVVHGPLTW